MIAAVVRFKLPASVDSAKAAELFQAPRPSIRASRAQIRTPASGPGTSRHFPALQNLVAVGA